MSRPIRIYVAGKMDWKDEEDSTWTPVLNHELRRELATYLPPTVQLVYPDETGFDHGGDIVAGIVAADLALLRSCDALIAVLSTPEQNGTLIELLDALYLGMDCLVIFIDPTARARGSGHVEVRAESDAWWFLANYLVGDRSDEASHSGFGNVITATCRTEEVPHMITTWVRRLIDMADRVRAL